MTDIVVTLPKSFGLNNWLAEGDAPGDEWSGNYYDFTVAGNPNIASGERVYVVHDGRLIGYAPLIAAHSDGDQQPNAHYPNRRNASRDHRKADTGLPGISLPMVEPRRGGDGDVNLCGCPKWKWWVCSCGEHPTVCYSPHGEERSDGSFTNVPFRCIRGGKWRVIKIKCDEHGEQVFEEDPERKRGLRGQMVMF